MNTIREHAEDYLAMRRALGFELTTFGQKLLSFIDYLETHEMSVLTTEAALTWATSSKLSMAAPREIGQTQTMRVAIVKSSLVLDQLDQAIAALKDAA